VTPYTAEGTALEKYGRAYPGAVVNAKALNIKNVSVHFNILSEKEHLLRI
jgi:hypothetical protein